MLELAKWIVENLDYGMILEFHKQDELTAVGSLFV